MPNLVLNLLHLSDLHFGCDRTGLAHRQREQALDLLIDALPKEPYHALLISGDLTWQGKKEGYVELRTWLETKLFPRTGLSPKDCVFCPGNHDIDRGVAESYQDRANDAAHADKLLQPGKPGFAPAFQHFIDFACGFGVPEPQPSYLSGIRELHGLRFVALNSAWFCRDSQTDKGNLWLGLPHLQSLLPHDTAKYDDEPLTIALVHHPDSWLNDADTNAYGIRPPAYRYLADRAHLILSGHTHGAVERCSRKYDRAREILAGAGYSTHDYRNNFSLLQIDPHQRTLVRRPWELDPRGPTWEAKPQQTYSLKLETITHQPHADPGRYLDWLRSETQFIALHQLNLSPTEVPPPAIDILYVRLKATPPARGEQLDRLEPAGLEEALKHPRLVIEGAPGGGKTTFLRWVAWTLVSGPPADWAVQDRCPLFLRLHEFDQYVASQPDPTKRSIPHFLGSRGWGLDDAYFEQRLQSADTVLLLDGLDEAATVQRRIDLVKLITQAAAHYPCRIVVTSRPGAHEGRATLQNFALARIEDLDPAGVEGFLRQWCQWLKKTAPEADAYYQELAPAVTIAGIRHLARNPLMLTALAVLHFRRHRLPDQRAKLYEQILDWLAEQATDRHPEYTKDQRLETFGQLALAMQSAPGGQILTIGIDDAAQLLPPPFAERVKFLEQAHVDSGIVTLRGKELVFWHRSFQEYLAARILLGETDQQLHPRAIGFLYSPEGREVLPLLAARLAEGGKNRLDALLEALIAHALAQTGLEQKAHAVGVLGAMLTDAAPSKYELKDQTAYAKLRQSVMRIFEKGQAAKIGVKTRAAAAAALDQASQARLRMPNDPQYWIAIPGGPFPRRDEKAFQSLARRNASLPAFRMAKFAVTVWEYDQFLCANDGMEQPSGWDEQFHHPGRPVTSVSWQEAQRYCAWSGAQLPTDEQWEFAARGAGGRIFPWGSEKQVPDDSRANFGNNVGAPSPVGLFPDGETPEGVADLAGNVWEWTRSDFDEPDQTSASFEARKSVRGGSVSHVADFLRAGLQVGVARGSRSSDLGFRCVRE